MKVAMITGSYPHHQCGVGDYTERLARELANQEVDIYVVTMDRPDIKNVDDSGVMVFKSVDAWSFRKTWRLLKTIRATRPEVIHIQYPSRGYGWSMLPSFLPMLLWLTFRRTSRVVTIHEFTIANRLRKIAIALLLQFSNRIVLPDLNERRAILRWFPWLRRRCVVIPIGTNIDPIPARNGVRRVATPYLAYFGFISQSKDTRTLFEAFKRLRAQRVRCRLLMIAQLPASDRALIRSMGLNNAVEVTGYCPPAQVSAYLSRAAVCVLPFTDGVSLRRTTFLAALKHGLPVATTRGDYIPRGLKNWGNVVLTPIGDNRRMADAVARLMRDPGLRRRMADRARRFSRRFEWQAIGRAHRNLYRSVSRGAYNRLHRWSTIRG